MKKLYHSIQLSYTYILNMQLDMPFIR